MALDLRTIDELRRIAPTLGISNEIRTALDTVYNYAVNQRTPEQQPIHGESIADALARVDLRHAGQDDENPDAFNWQLQQVEARIQAVSTRGGEQLSQHQQPFHRPAANQQPLKNQHFMNKELRNQPPHRHNHQRQNSRVFNCEGPSLRPYNALLVQQPTRHHPLQQQPRMNQQSLDQPPLQSWDQQVSSYSRPSPLPYDQLFMQQLMPQQAMSQQPVQQQRHHTRGPGGPEFRDSRQQQLQPQSCMRIPMLQLYQPQSPMQHQPQQQPSHSEPVEAQQQMERILHSQFFSHVSATRFSEPHNPQ